MKTKTNSLLRLAGALALAFLSSSSSLSTYADSESPESQTMQAQSVAEEAETTADARPFSLRSIALSSTLSYYTVSGVAFQPRESSVGYAYSGVGCIRATNAAGGVFVTNLPIADESQLKFLRLYTYDSATGKTGGAYITSYNRQGTHVDIVGISSSSGTGYRTFLSSAITTTVDTTANSYVVNWVVNNDSTALCGVRVAYYAPTFFSMFLPLLDR